MRQRVALMAIAACLVAAGARGSDEAGYRLAYWFEVGGYHNQNCSPPCAGGGSGCTGFGNHSAYVHVWDSNGNKLGNKRVEDADNPGKYGITNNDPNDKFGFVEIPLFMNDTPRFTVNDGGVPSDIAWEMVENRSPTNGHYSWELGFIYVPGGLGVTFNTVLIGQPNLSGTPQDIDAPFTTSCAFYDTNPYAWTSDDYCLDISSSSYGQTFVANGNRVVAAKFQTTVGFLQDMRYGVTIRQGGPGGTTVGPQAVSRWMKSDEYFTQLVCWPLFGEGAAIVVPGQTYYAEIVRADQPGSINIWRRDNDVYPDGQMYRGGSPVSGKDLIGRIICASVQTGPQIAVQPVSFERTVGVGHSPSNDTFEVWNSGEETLNYSITDNAGWLSQVPDSGTSNGEHDLITIQYNTASLPLGDYHAQIEVADAAASNSPQTVTVTVHVVPVTYIGDCDGDDDVDQEDFGWFQACLSGPGIEQPDPLCACARLDPDVDVDQDDFAIFEACMSGADITPGWSCEK